MLFCKAGLRSRFYCSHRPKKFIYFCNKQENYDLILCHMKPSSFQILFLVPGSYSLSIRDLDHNTGEGVKHYRIRNMDNGGFYITAKISFNSLKELVQHYSRACSLSIISHFILKNVCNNHFIPVSTFCHQGIQMGYAQSC